MRVFARTIALPCFLFVLCGCSSRINGYRAQSAFERGRKEMLANDYAKAETDVRLAADLEPNKPLFHFTLGLLLMARKDYTSARKAFAHANELAPTHASYLAWLAQCDNDLKDYKQAEIEANAAHVFDSTDEFAAAALGHADYHLGKYPEALEAYGSAIALAPRVPSYQEMYGRSLGRLRRYSEARPHLILASQLMPKSFPDSR